MTAPAPVGAGEEREARAGWGDEGECSAGDGTKARYDLLIWNRCTSVSFHLILSMQYHLTRRARRMRSLVAGRSCPLRALARLSA
ncbi:protein of unknown function [Methanoculleus bourgensis]|uniref:Uncharacterized protein n=1 Tax=Methanoculleus bourgensis TaxID=83986 RepID=A0A0X3BNV9_9EURY|nr:protein of unknown function [Methanoculleus bourgensis]